MPLRFGQLNELPRVWSRRPYAQTRALGFATTYVPSALKRAIAARNCCKCGDRLDLPLSGSEQPVSG
jgi:hypothetical protein